MSEWKTKRFWKAVTTAKADRGYEIMLDGRAVRTPAKAPLVVPGAELAQAIAAEWEAQVDVVRPDSMPFTRSANAAIDKVAAQHSEVAALIAEYADSDLLCYRADAPAELVARQATTWDPLIGWAEQAHGLVFRPRTGVIHAPQSPETLELAHKLTARMPVFRLTAFHDLVALSGSFVIGLAAVDGLMPPADLWAVSRLDELWQEEQWGADEEAQIAIARKAAAFEHAARFHDLCRNGALDAAETAS